MRRIPDNQSLYRFIDIFFYKLIFIFICLVVADVTTRHNYYLCISKWKKGSRSQLNTINIFIVFISLLINLTIQIRQNDFIISHLVALSPRLQMSSSVRRNVENTKHRNTRGNKEHLTEENSAGLSGCETERSTISTWFVIETLDIYSSYWLTLTRSRRIQTAVTSTDQRGERTLSLQRAEGLFTTQPWLNQEIKMISNIPPPPNSLGNRWDEAQVGKS